MKINIQLDPDCQESEITIKCKNIDGQIRQLQDSIEKIFNKTDKIIFYDDDKEYYLDIDQILFFETSESTVFAHTVTDFFIVKRRLYELLETLPGSFSRISKSAIVNTNKIYSVTKGLTTSLLTFHGTHKTIYVSRQYYSALKLKLRER